MPLTLIVALRCIGMSSGCDNDKELISIGTLAQFELEHHVGSGTNTVTWTDGRIEKGQKKRGEGEGLSDHPTDDCFFGEIGFVKRRRIHESGLQRADPLGRREHFNSPETD